ncbi:hypothetical protein B0O99DRAFT_614053 [Bisporella sp. PMI_857]|nr:hypothetical protein B0O99DRAFT_614053 [Bisporella sp. PMI_857]
MIRRLMLVDTRRGWLLRLLSINISHAYMMKPRHVRQDSRHNIETIYLALSCPPRAHRLWAVIRLRNNLFEASMTTLRI